jgi:hypothetical protein
MQACGVGGITPHIRNLDFSMQVHCPAILFTCYTSNKNLGRRRATADTWENRGNHLSLSESELRRWLKK